MIGALRIQVMNTLPIIVGAFVHPGDRLSLLFGFHRREGAGARWNSRPVPSQTMYDGHQLLSKLTSGS